MKHVKLYHNPRCSKSRQALALLEENEVKPDVHLYMEKPLTRAEIKGLLQALDMPARDLLRRSEAAYKDKGLDDENLSEDDLIEAMLEEPRLIQRPIAISGKKAVIGRPPENVLELI